MRSSAARCSRRCPSRSRRSARATCSLNPSFEQAGTSGKPVRAAGTTSRNGPDHPPTIATTSDAHAGSKALAISVPAGYDSWAYNLITPVARSRRQCSPTAIPGHHYTFSGWYKGNGPIKVVAYWRNADNQWSRLDWGSRRHGVVPGVRVRGRRRRSRSSAPAGATARQRRLLRRQRRPTGHTYTIDDTSLVDDDATAPVHLRAHRGARRQRQRLRHEQPGRHRLRRDLRGLLHAGATVTLTGRPRRPARASPAGAAPAPAAPRHCTVTMSAAQSVTATLRAPARPARRVAKAGTGGGSVTSSPAGIDCGATCHASVANGTTVTLTADAAAGSSLHRLERRVQRHGHDLHRCDDRRQVGHGDVHAPPGAPHRREGGHGQRHRREHPGGHHLRRDLRGRLRQRRDASR